MVQKLFPRQYDYEGCTLTADGDIDESSCYVPFWNTKVGCLQPLASHARMILTPLQTGYIVKWSVFLAIVAIISLYLLLGYMHAQRRIRKGLAPLGYHRVCPLSTAFGASVLI
jgi:hypothetical protein